MQRALAALILIAILALPATALARQSRWEQLKEEWGYRPWAVIIAVPALLVTAPFMLAKDLIAKIEESDEDD
jgi:hypothetical protein